MRKSDSGSSKRKPSGSKLKSKDTGKRRKSAGSEKEKSTTREKSKGSEKEKPFRADRKSATASRSKGKSSTYDDSNEEGAFKKKRFAKTKDKEEFKPRSSRSTGDKKPFSKDDSRSERAFGKRDAEGARPRTSRNSDDKKPFRKDDSRGERPESKREPESFKPRSSRTSGSRKPFDREEKGADKPYSKRKSRMDDSGEEKKSSGSYGDYREKTRSSSRTREGSEEKPLREKSGDKPFRGKSEGVERVSRSFRPKEGTGRSSEKGSSKSDDTRPFRSRGAGDEKKPYKSRTAGRSTASRSSKSNEGPDDGLIRLNRYIANTGICSRREADELIEAGAVMVNGIVVTEMGYKVNPQDEVRYGGETLRKERMMYLVLNKPKDYITTTDDPQERKTVMQLIKDACKERVYPVGRLDRETTGVLLFTNDGELTKRLTHPKYEIKKIYHVELEKNFKLTDIKKLKEGIELEDGFIKPDSVEFVGDKKNEVGIELHSGKNRVVRRLFEAMGYHVVKLDRVFFAGLTKKDLPRGRWRFLNAMELNYLKMQTGSKG